jgi:hypothetical protein
VLPLQFVVDSGPIRNLPWLYNSTNAILPIVIICHAIINTADRFVLREFANKNYQVVWLFTVGLYVLPRPS